MRCKQGPSREAAASAREFGRLPYSRASFERVAHLVGALAVADHQDIEDALIDAVEVPVQAPRRHRSGRPQCPGDPPPPEPRPGAPPARNWRVNTAGGQTLARSLPLPATGLACTAWAITRAARGSQPSSTTPARRLTGSTTRPPGCPPRSPD